MNLLKRFGMVAVVLAFATVPVAAQQVALNDMRASARVACLGGDADACQAAVQAYIDAMTARGITGASMDNALASFASSLADAAIRMPAAVRDVVSAVIRTTVAPAMNDQGQARQLLAAADTVSTGVQTTLVAQGTDASAE